ncbi:hypothetical protein RBH39_24355 [Escherichia coli]|uniref:hypothetical protein n=1 Tax=Escherichia coli TaxID=562 RepID=UPI0027F3B90E|nr:hypothetical protein [Escherichia coli]
MQPGESRTDCQLKTPETDIFHTFGSVDDREWNRKTKFQMDERDLAIKAKTQQQRHTRIAPGCVLTRSCTFGKIFDREHVPAAPEPGIIPKNAPETR